jgi:hypothetical protein
MPTRRTTKRSRRTIQDQITDLEAQLAELRERAAAQWLDVKGMAPAKAYEQLGIEDTSKDRGRLSPEAVAAEREADS